MHSLILAPDSTTNRAEFTFDNTALRTYALPDASGTVALTSNLSSYLPLTGGILTGDLTIAKSSSLNNFTLSSTSVNAISFITNSVGKGEISVGNTYFQFSSYTSGGYIFKNSASSNLLTITDAGAATFSSSVTVNGKYIVPSTSYFVGNATYGYRFNNAADTSNLLVITDSGNVGIGTSSPTSFSGNTVLSINNAAGGAVLELQSNGTSAFRMATSSSDSALWEPRNVPVLFATNNTERMRITSGGNVGIGTSTTPSYQNYRYLQVTGSSTTQGGVLYLTTSDSSYIGEIAVNSSGLILSGATANANVLMYAGGTERMRITSGGFTKISNTGGYLGGTTSSHNEISNFNATSGDINLVLGLGANTNNTSSYFLLCGRTGVDVMYVYGNGNIVNTNGSYGTLSDATLKENIVDATPKLDDILQLKVRNFNLIGDDTKQIGFIAQEFEEVFPAMIDIDGKSGKKAIKTSVLVPMLVKAIQEQQAQIEELKELIKSK